jgi:hypothetical protein
MALANLSDGVRTGLGRLPVFLVELSVLLLATNFSFIMIPFVANLFQRYNHYLIADLFRGGSPLLPPESERNGHHHYIRPTDQDPSFQQLQ